MLDDQFRALLEDVITAAIDEKVGPIVDEIKALRANAEALHAMLGRRLFVDSKAAAELLGVSVATINSLMKRGKLEGQRRPGHRSLVATGSIYTYYAGLFSQGMRAADPGLVAQAIFKASRPQVVRNAA